MATMQKVNDGKISPEIIPQGNGKYTLKKIPIFLCHKRGSFVADANWMNKLVYEMGEMKKKGRLARIITGHTRKDGEEKPINGYLDNFYFNESNNVLYSDFVDVNEETANALKDNQLPNRSAEVIPEDNKIINLALLSSSPPYLELEDIRYQNNKTTILYSLYEKGEITMSYEDNKEKDTKKEDTGLGSDKTGPDQDAIDAAKWDMAMDSYCKKNCHKIYAHLKNYEKSLGVGADPVDETHKESEIKEEPTKKETETPKETNKVSKKDGIGDKLDGDKNRDEEHDERLKKEYALQQKLEKYETDKWIAKYESLKVPASVIDVKSNVEIIMALPEDKRELHYKLSTKNLPSGPAEKKREVMNDVIIHTKVEEDPIKRYQTEHKIETYEEAHRIYMRFSRAGIKKG